MFKLAPFLCLFICSPVFAEHLCTIREVWVDMDCSLCDSEEVCLDGGCCPNDMVSSHKDVCCDYITFDGKCHYRGGACPDGMIWDKTTGSCIVNCSKGVWTGTRCCDLSK